MGLREFSLKRFLKKNFDFIAGMLVEFGLAGFLILVVFAISAIVTAIGVAW